MSLSVSLPNDLEQYLFTQASYQGVPIELLLSRTIEERWSGASRAKRLSQRESEILLKIQSIFPPEQTQEYLSLCGRSDDGSITEVERERLIALNESRDIQNAERLELLGELAHLRGVTLREIMKSLEIRPA